MIEKLQAAKEKFYNRLEQKIQVALQENRPIKSLVEQQIKLIQEAHDEFIAAAKIKGFNLQSRQVGEVEIYQYSAMKALANKIGLPVEEYDVLIKSIQARIGK